MVDAARRHTFDLAHFPAFMRGAIFAHAGRGWTRRGRIAAGTPFATRAALVGSLPVALYLVAAYWITAEVIPGRLSPDYNVYVAQPLLWSGLGVLAYLLWRRLPDRPALRRSLVALAMLSAAFQLALLVSAGMLYGFGNSPYASQAVNVAKNAMHIATLLFGLEMARAYLLHSWGRVSPVLGFAAVVLMFAVVTITPGQFGLLGSDSEHTFRLAGATMLPALSESAMATFLASIGGPLPAFAYRFSLEAFQWFSPALPRLDWTVAAFVGTLAPVLAMLLTRDAYLHGSSREEKEEERQAGTSPFWLLAAGLAAGLVWFNSGLFGVQPSLVSGVSMNPSYEVGDVIITREVDTSSLQVGDVIKYRAPNGSAIFHRIVEIEPRSGVFITKGDNNNVDDPPILSSQVEGRVVAKVPYLGWLPIKFSQWLLDPLR